MNDVVRRAFLAAQASDVPVAPPVKKTARGPRSVQRSPRRRAREFALQALYAWRLSGADAGVVDAHIREQAQFERCDAAAFDALLHGTIADLPALEAAVARHLDRPVAQLSPIEHAILLLAAFELKHSIELPYKVVINEAVELAKTFGGTDGHKFVNGVVDRVARDLRQVEIDAS